MVAAAARDGLQQPSNRSPTPTIRVTDVEIKVADLSGELAARRRKPCTLDAEFAPLLQLGRQPHSHGLQLLHQLGTRIWRIEIKRCFQAGVNPTNGFDDVERRAEIFFGFARKTRDETVCNAYSRTSSPAACLDDLFDAILLLDLIQNGLRTGLGTDIDSAASRSAKPFKELLG